MNSKSVSRISLYSALVVAILLGLAALAKWLYPLPQSLFLNKIAIVSELLAAFLLLVFHRSVIAWSIISLLFSLWLGYSLFWLVYHEPCGCFGALGGIPKGVAFGLDLFLLALSWINMVCLHGEIRKILITIFLAFLLAIAGFWIATYMFTSQKNILTFLLE